MDRINNRINYQEKLPYPVFLEFHPPTEKSDAWIYSSEISAGTYFTGTQIDGAKILLDRLKLSVARLEKLIESEERISCS